MNLNPACFRSIYPQTCCRKWGWTIQTNAVHLCEEVDTQVSGERECLGRQNNQEVWRRERNSVSPTRSSVLTRIRSASTSAGPLVAPQSRLIRRVRAGRIRQLFVQRLAVPQAAPKKLWPSRNRRQRVGLVGQEAPERRVMSAERVSGAISVGAGSPRATALPPQSAARAASIRDPRPRYLLIKPSRATGSQRSARLPRFALCLPTNG